MKSQIERIRHNFQEVREMHELIENEIKDIEKILDTNNNRFRPLPLSEIERIFGKFDYISKPNGGINITDGWQNKNTVMLCVNKIKIWCNKLVAPQFAGTFAEIIAAGLQDEINLDNGGGCFVPRHKNWDITRGLSYHSWGIALDNRPNEFPYDSKKRQHPEVIRIFRKWGFYYGGDFKTPDPMHYEWCQFAI
jgi:hypothetical protein